MNQKKLKNLLTLKTLFKVYFKSNTLISTTYKQVEIKKIKRLQNLKSDQTKWCMISYNNF